MTRKRISILFTVFVALASLAFLPGLAQAQPAADPLFTWGNGADGDLTINANGAFNISDNNHSGRTCSNGGDAVSYEIIGITSNTATLRTSPASGCLNVGDEFILINLQGSAGTTGNYELLRIKNISANLVTFTSNKTKFYGVNAGDDSGLTSSQHVVLQRVPNYNNLTLNGDLLASSWNGKQYGLMVFRVKGSWIGSGNINVSNRGYRGGAQGQVNQGESWPGPGQISNLPNGGGGAGNNICPGGQGNYAGGTTTENCAMPNGDVYGSPPLNRLYLGSGGGGRTMTKGGDGGGAVYVMANNINFLGTISAQGDYGVNTGSGSGGSIRIEGVKIKLGALNAMGIQSKEASKAISGVGRIAIYYVQSWSSSLANPIPYVQQVSAVPTASPTRTRTRTRTATPIKSLTPAVNTTGTALAQTATALFYNSTGTALAKTVTALAQTPDYNATGTAFAQTATALSGTPDYNATATALAGNSTPTPDFFASATAMWLTATARAATATPSPDYIATDISDSLTATAQAATSTPDFFASATAMWLTATARAATATPSPDYIATDISDSLTATAQAVTSTPDFFASATAMWLTATARAVSPTPDLNATGTAQSLTATAQALTSTPDFNATGTAQAQTATAAANATSSLTGGGNGSGSNDNNNSTPTPGSASVGSGFDANCNMGLNVYVYVDSNNDNMMAAQGEGVNNLEVDFLDTSYGKVGQSYVSNGKASFCVPDYLRGQTLRVDIPYLQRTGVMQATQDNNNRKQPLEIWFRLEPPTLPLFIP